MIELANAVVLLLLGGMLFFPLSWRLSYSRHCPKLRQGIFCGRCFRAITFL